MNPRVWMLCLLIIMVALTACGGESTPTPDLEATQVAVHTAAVATLTAEAPTATNTPTDTPTPTPTEAPTDTPQPSDTPIPTSTNTPRPSPMPTITQSPTPTLAPTSPPKVTCRPAKKGWIGFKRQKRCNAKTAEACGPVQIWIMKADGSSQAPMCDKSDYSWALKKDQTSPDGSWYVDVAWKQGNDIRRVFNDGRQEWIIINNRDDWDPAVSADGWWLAWVTNRNANDEIYVKTMDPRDQNQRRLTTNDWQWDKHPTWSPDGRRIAFYSNRADRLSEATRQIWVMDVVNGQGVNLRNLSQRPNRVDTDPVWFKWTNIP